MAPNRAARLVLVDLGRRLRHGRSEELEAFLRDGGEDRRLVGEVVRRGRVRHSELSGQRPEVDR
jgi:hypothetical protein